MTSTTGAHGTPEAWLPPPRQVIHLGLSGACSRPPGGRKCFQSLAVLEESCRCFSFTRKYLRENCMVAAVLTYNSFIPRRRGTCLTQGILHCCSCFPGLPAWTACPGKTKDAVSFGSGQLLHLGISGRGEEPLPLVVWKRASVKTPQQETATDASNCTPQLTELCPLDY